MAAAAFSSRHPVILVRRGSAPTRPSILLDRETWKKSLNHVHFAFFQFPTWKPCE
jgi:hypothetical protein